MFSSAKFLSPIVTAGLPAPGPPDALAPAAALLLVVLDDLLLPHAARSTLIATTPSAATIILLLPCLQVLPGMRRLLCSLGPAVDQVVAPPAASAGAGPAAGRRALSPSRSPCGVSARCS